LSCADQVPATVQLGVEVKQVTLDWKRPQSDTRGLLADDWRVSLGAARHSPERSVCQAAGDIFTQARSGTDNKGVRTLLSSSEFPRFKANNLES